MIDTDDNTDAREPTAGDWAWLDKIPGPLDDDFVQAATERTTQRQIHVGESLDDIGARAIAAWHRMKRGEELVEKHVGFSDWETMVRLLSPKRLELLRHLHRTPAKNIRALAQALGRDYRRVHEDVEALAGAGLLDRDKDGVKTEYDALDARIRVAL